MDIAWRVSIQEFCYAFFFFFARICQQKKYQEQLLTSFNFSSLFFTVSLYFISRQDRISNTNPFPLLVGNISFLITDRNWHDTRLIKFSSSPFFFSSKARGRRLNIKKNYGSFKGHAFRGILFLEKHHSILFRITSSGCNYVPALPRIIPSSVPLRILWTVFHEFVTWFSPFFFFLFFFFYRHCCIFV